MLIIFIFHLRWGYISSSIIQLYGTHLRLSQTSGRTECQNRQINCLSLATGHCDQAPSSALVTAKISLPTLSDRGYKRRQQESVREGG